MKRTTLHCCPVGKTIILSYDLLDLYAIVDAGAQPSKEQRQRAAETYLSTLRSTPPIWTMYLDARVLSHIYPYADALNMQRVVARFCPGCGSAVPDLQLKARPPKKITIVVDGGYYCETCEERLMGCDCADPATLWEPVG